MYLTESLLNDTELDKPAQETLAVIAYKSPIFQNEVFNETKNLYGRNTHLGVVLFLLDGTRYSPHSGASRTYQGANDGRKGLSACGEVWYRSGRS